ncbi:Endopolyphosphatase [Diaporthe australafricana]|uniref:Endopolyphosphatase n=1 Tax=Diaporthe australafricana TaxID=127596 RepID=A0ABR3W556_9PEZI
MAAGAIMLLAAGLAHLCTGVIAAPALAQPQIPLAAGALEQHPMGDTPPSPPPIASQKKTTQSRKLHGRFLHITEQGRACHSGKGPAGTYGAETSDCDTPISLVNATFDWITSSKLRDEIDFVIWTGDSARHDSDEDIPRSPAQVLGTNRLLANKFAETFSGDNGANVPVIPTFGNNDILPHNVLMPGPNKWLRYYTDIWRRFIPEEQRHSFEFGGWFYVEVIPNKLAVFSLNTLYFFDRNAGVDDCVKPSEPGFRHMEWLRVQLQFMRDRGMKAILMGHVPPARTDSKMLWDETCWQKYTLWLKQYRDVVISGLYGHMNIDHFVLMDTNEIDTRSAEVESEDEDITVRENLDDELSLQSATDYLEELREGWAELPKPGKPKSQDFESEKKKKKKKKGKKDKDKNKLDGEWAERYQLALVSPSIVPNYFPTLRVFEYNITGLEDAVTWADYTKKLPTVRPKFDADETSLVELELRDLDLLDLDDDIEAEKKKHKGDKNKKKKKKKKGKKPKDPNLVIPEPPAKSSPPGPAYSPQPLTLTGYKQYFANLTYINNDIAPQTEDLDAEKWRKGKHGNKMPKTKKPKPREFQFEIEYTTYDDKLYNLTDLTVKSFVELAYRMGKTAKAKTAQLLLPGGDLVDNLGDLNVDEAEDHDLSEFEQDMSESDGEDDTEDSEADDVEAEKKKKGKKDKKKKKKKKKKAKKPNKTWLHFLRHAFVSTVNDEELKEKFS